LLHTGNSDTKKEYLRLIPIILSYSKENGTHIEDTRQLLSYSLIHPACTSEERSQFTMWIGQLEEIFTYGIQIALSLLSLHKLFIYAENKLKYL
jgi:hypothetical protein